MVGEWVAVCLYIGTHARMHALTRMRACVLAQTCLAHVYNIKMVSDVTYSFCDVLGPRVCAVCL